MSAELDLDNVFAQVNDQFATSSKARERIFNLNELGSGRGITRVRSNSLVPNDLIGYILPLNLKQTRHLVLFGNGEKIVVEPDKINTLAQFLLYLQSFNPNNSPTEISSLDSLIVIRENFFQAPNPMNCRTIFNSHNPNHQIDIERAEEEAAALQSELVGRALAARQTALKSLLAQTAGFLKLSKATPGEFTSSGWGD